jgi:hypothetical protein
MAMVLEIGGELAVYLVVCALGISIGISSGMTLPRGLGVVIAIANVVIVGGAVAVGFLFGSEAPWIGPIFAFAALVMRVVTGAMELDRVPALSEDHSCTEPCWCSPLDEFASLRTRTRTRTRTILP